MNATGGPDRLTSSLSVFLPLLQEPKTIDQISQATGRSYPSLWRSLDMLIDEGIIKKIDVSGDAASPKYAYVSLYILSSG